jgi:outer membrane receptor protein involved in Fe transport
MRKYRSPPTPGRRLIALLAVAWCPAAALADDDTQLPSITITAQKRSEDMIKVPISAMAMDQAMLDEQGVKDVADLGRLVPGLTFQSSDDAGDTNIAIRGIISTVGASTTGIYIDDVPVMVRLDSGVGSNAYPKVFDLDRIEVLRGPQGTLFGAGAEGGVLRFITPEASLHKFSGFASADLAITRNGDPSYEAGAAVGGPIIENTLGYRFSAWHQVEGGYGDRVDPVTGRTTNSRDNSSESSVLHLNFKWHPTADLVITPGIFYQKSVLGDVGLFSEANGSYNIASQIAQQHDDSFTLSTLAVDYDFGAFSFKSISSYIDRKVFQRYDGTGYELGSITGSTTVPFDPYYLVTIEYPSTQTGISQEFRLTSSDQPGNPLSWVTGLFFRSSRTVSQGYYVDPGFDALSNYLSLQNYGVPGNALSYWGESLVNGLYSYTDNFPSIETDLAAYGDASYAITPSLKVSAGLRIARSGYSYKDYEDGPWGPAAPFFKSGSAAEKPITPRVNLTWQIDQQRMVYASAAKGYRPGGANEPVPTNANGGCGNDLATLGLAQVPSTYGSDSLWSYEAGLKGRFLDRKLLLESSAYWINWNQVQQNISLPTCGYAYIGNLGHAVSRGFDAQVEWAASEHLVISATSGYTDAHLTDTILVGGQMLTKAGDRLATPAWTFTVGPEYRSSWRGAETYARVDYDFNGSYQRMGSADTYGSDPLTSYAPPVRTASARIGAKFNGWEISGYGNNLFNKDTSLFRYRSNINTTDLRDTRLRPLTMGVSLKYKF